VQVFVLECHR